MSALITAGVPGTKANIALTGESRVIVSGLFGNGATVLIELDGDGLRKANIHTFRQQGGIDVGATNADNLTATINGGGPGTSIDVSVTAI